MATGRQQSVRIPLDAGVVLNIFGMEKNMIICPKRKYVTLACGKLVSSYVAVHPDSPTPCNVK